MTTREVMMTGVAETIALIAAKIETAMRRPLKKRVVSVAAIGYALTGSTVVIAGHPAQTAATGPVMITEVVNDAAGMTVETDKGSLVSRAETAPLSSGMIVEIADLLDTAVVRDKPPALMKAAAVTKCRLDTQKNESLLAEMTKNLAHGHDLQALNLVPAVTQAVVVIAQAVLTAV